MPKRPQILPTLPFTTAGFIQGWPNAEDYRGLLWVGVKRALRAQHLHGHTQMVRIILSSHWRKQLTKALYGNLGYLTWQIWNKSDFVSGSFRRIVKCTYPFWIISNLVWKMTMYKRKIDHALKWRWRINICWTADRWTDKVERMNKCQDHCSLTFETINLKLWLGHTLKNKQTNKKTRN